MFRLNSFASYGSNSEWFFCQIFLSSSLLSKMDLSFAAQSSTSRFCMLSLEDGTSKAYSTHTGLLFKIYSNVQSILLLICVS